MVSVEGAQDNPHRYGGGLYLFLVCCGRWQRQRQAESSGLLVVGVLILLHKSPRFEPLMVQVVVQLPVTCQHAPGQRKR